MSVNKPAKDFLRRKYEEWYTEQIIKQLEGKDLETSTLEPIDLGSAVVKEKSAKWLVELYDYMASNPQIIVNGFIKTGITGALDGQGEETDLEDDDDCSDSEDDEFVDDEFY